MLKARRGKDDMSQSDYDTVISKDVTLQGTVQASGVLRIDGKIEGRIDTQGDVIVGKDGVVIAQVSAKNVVVAGQLQGDVDVSGRLQILPGGKLFGDAKVSVLVVEEGAIFKGQCDMEVQRPGETSKRIARRIDTTTDATATEKNAPVRQEAASASGTSSSTNKSATS